MRKLNTILEVFLYLVIIRHIIALFTTIPQIGMAISGYVSLFALAWNFVLHIAMIMILLNLLKIKKWALYLFGGIQLINIAFQSLFFGRDFWELTIVAVILCAIKAALLCLRKDGISAWQLFFPREELTPKDNQDIEFEMLQEEDASNYKKRSTEIPEDEINTTATTNDEIEDLTIDTLPQKEDGSLDYEKMTPIQQFAYTCKTESVEVALKDLNADIKALEKSIGKVKKELSSLSGGNRAKLRDSLREEQMKLDELYNLRNKYAVKKKWNWKYVLIIIAVTCFLTSLFCWFSFSNVRTNKIEPIEKNEIVNNKENKTIGQYTDTKERLYSFIYEEGYDNFSSIGEFMNYITSVHNRKKIVNALKQEGYDIFYNQLELDTYLGYESVYYTYYNDDKIHVIPISVANHFERNNPSARIVYLNKNKIEIVSISEKDNIKLKNPEARPHLVIKIKTDYKQSKRRLLYYILLSTGYLSENELGTMSEFLNTINSKEKIKEFYWDLLNWGFVSSELGSEAEFYENLSTDFSTIKNAVIKNKKNDISARDRVYNKLKSLGLTDSKEDFLKYYDSDENVRKRVYQKLREAGLTDSETEFYEYMKPQK